MIFLSDLQQNNITKGKSELKKTEKKYKEIRERKIIKFCFK